MDREPTEFEKRCYEALCRVPSGRVVTYKTLGVSVGCNSGQAVGNAMRRNPFAPEVPCHRVILSSLSLGGYLGEIGGERVERKRLLLEGEGVFFGADGRLRDVGCLLDVI